MDITGFNPEKAEPAHNGTILAHEVIPEGMNAPFDSAWGYLEKDAKMDGHSHPHKEIYIVIKGKGKVIVGDKAAEVRAGDVIEIPPDEYHTMECGDEEALLWAAFWW